MNASAMQHLAPVGRSGTLGQKVRQQLREAIMAGHFVPGEKLTIRAIAAALGVSPTPAREALFHLASEGVLETRSNGSIYIPELTEAGIVELTKIRTALESLAAREAARSIGDATIEAIVALNERIGEADRAGNYRSVVALNWELHFSIYQASAMPQLVRLIEGCWLATGSYLNLIYPEFGKTDEGLQNHLRIVRALKARDGERLSSAVIADIHFATDALLRSIGAAA